MILAVDWPVNWARLAIPLWRRGRQRLCIADMAEGSYQIAPRSHTLARGQESRRKHHLPIENAKPLPGAKYVEKILCCALSIEPSPMAAMTFPKISSA